MHVNIKNGTIFVMKEVQNEQLNPIPKLLSFKEIIFAGSEFKVIFSLYSTTFSIIIFKKKHNYICIWGLKRSIESIIFHKNIMH